MQTAIVILTVVIILLLFYIGYLKCQVQYENEMYRKSVKNRVNMEESIKQRYEKLLEQADRIILLKESEVVKEKEKNKFLSDQNIYLHSLIPENVSQEYIEGSDVIRSQRLKESYNRFIDILQTSK